MGVSARLDCLIAFLSFFAVFLSLPLFILLFLLLYGLNLVYNKIFIVFPDSFSGFLYFELVN